jgi:hypothetical protein
LGVRCWSVSLSISWMSNWRSVSLSSIGWGSYSVSYWSGGVCWSSILGIRPSDSDGRSAIGNWGSSVGNSHQR